MLDRLDQQSPDALLALIKLHNADPREDKIDLGVGVYKTADGATPVFRAIKDAEQRLVDRQQSKSYLGPEGDMAFVRALEPHVFGTALPSGGRIDGMQTPGGTGAVRLAFGLAKKAGITRVFMGVPSWPNHAQILDDLGLEAVPFDHATSDGTADMAALRQVLANAGEGDALLLHGCCHNPTGVDYTPVQWDAIASLLADSAMLPVIDLAYQGLGDGMDEDAYGLRTVSAAVPELLVAYSCDKNFGLYRDRVGAFWVQSAIADTTVRAISNAAALARANWSMPPDHGGAAVRMVLEDEALTASWLAELASMRERIGEVRARLAAAGHAGGVDLAPLGRQKGMFAMLPVSAAQVQTLRDAHGVYMAGSGRINVAGLTMTNVDRFVAALDAVTG
ncbi:aminotransferase class I/II-fold pyridoxal phosphate-dependent enzyme [Erythrobacter arachoides]|uniref:Aminotransferase class I/II-fold pyridoxal phosphate-dependent enzyme n=1 Tax=Aurantiacibacter arachoides TaxID=1850444 RepID=A0A845A3W3_9SPHN|nr:aromatic amino acid transaminase [Aurantiacibacter arachoides]MXO94112.1 aminotransferase class I/II-fold pyridoxal phosphate-dependent enzyme [Aurantiacibacter arachoides]